MPDVFENTKKIKDTMACFLILVILIASASLGPLIVHATDPSMSDLGGTDSSDRAFLTLGRRYDIDGNAPGTYGLQAGEDEDSLAFGMKLETINAGYGFRVTQMGSGDKYEIYFTIGAEEFTFYFVSSGPSAGTIKIFHRDAGSSDPWSAGESFTESSISSGTRFESTSGNIAAKLTSSTGSTNGIVKLEAKKGYLASLGATGSIVTDISAYTYYGSSTDNPGADGGIKGDRCPQGTGTASFSLSGPIPEFPLGILLLAIPVIAIYLYMRRRSSIDIPTRFKGLV